MAKLTNTLLFLTLILGACLPNHASPEADSSADGNCAFTWAYHNLPEVTGEFDKQIKVLNPETSSRATAFGEDCIYEDGSSTFSAMETDFYIELKVDNLSDPESFGNWIVKSMRVVEQLPQEQVEGPKAGFVEFKFIQSDDEFILIRVSIQQYNETANGKTGEELFRMFYTE